MNEDILDILLASIQGWPAATPSIQKQAEVYVHQERIFAVMSAITPSGLGIPYRLSSSLFFFFLLVVFSQPSRCSSSSSVSIPSG